MSSNSEKIRSFIAIELSEEVKSGLARLRKELEKAACLPVKWVDPEGIHLTLKFLGNIPFRQIDRITKAVEEASQGLSPFHLEISGLGAFPNLSRARVLWVGIVGDVNTLLRLQQNIETVLTSLGFAKESRLFTPHLTLARIRQQASAAERESFGKLVMSVGGEISYPLNVTAISLVRSQLNPQGATYTCLSRVELKGL